MSNLNQLNKIWKSLKEGADSVKEKEDKKDEADVPRETEAKSEPKKEDTVAVSAVSVSTKVGTPSKKSLYGDKHDFVRFKDTNSKAPTSVEREMGSKEAVREFKVTNTAMEVTEPVPREMGAQEAVTDYKITNTPMDTVEPVPREMGAQEAPNDYLKEYKSKIGKALESIKESVKI